MLIVAFLVRKSFFNPDSLRVVLILQRYLKVSIRESYLNFKKYAIKNKESSV